MKELVQKYYVGYFGRPADKDDLDSWVDEADGNIETVINIFAAKPEYKNSVPMDGGEVDYEALVNLIYLNLFGREAEDEGRDFYVAGLVSEEYTVDDIVKWIINGALNGDVAALDNRAEVAQYFTDNLDGRDVTEDVYLLLAAVTDDPATKDAAIAGFDEWLIDAPAPPVVPSLGKTIYLTAGTDIEDGTAYDDEFLAYMSQNPMMGGVSNTLSSADRLDGKGGYNSLYAEVVPEFVGGFAAMYNIDIQPRTSNIQEMEFEVRDLGGIYHGIGGIIDGGIFTVSIDAKHMYDVERIGSKDSDGNLVIENLTTKTSGGGVRNTDAITITMDHTDNFNTDGDASDLTVYFDENYLLSGETAESQAFYYLLDQDADEVGDPLLNDINTNGLRFTIDGGDEQVIEFDKDLLADGTITNHTQFVAALQASLAALIAAGTVPADTTLYVNPDLTRTTFLDNGAVSSPIPAIVLETQTSAVIEAIGFQWIEDSIGDYNVYGRIDNDAETSDLPVGVNVELHKVGRGSEGGDLIIGGKSQSYDSEGIPYFYVDVLGDASKPSNLGTLGTTNDYLSHVYISTHDDYKDGSSFASLTIRGTEVDEDDVHYGGVFNQSSLNMVNANAFYGDLTLGSSAVRVENLTTLNAAGGGNVTFWGDIDEQDSIASGKDYSYTTGSGNDTINLTVDGNAVDAYGESLSINTGAGNDTVVVTLWDSNVSQQTMYLLDNLHINTGAGNDTVQINGVGRFNINTGSGNDLVYLYHGGDLQGESFGNPTGIQPWGTWANSIGPQVEARVLYEATMTVSYAGFENTVKVVTTAANNFVATQLDINKAIADAIENNSVLKELLEVTWHTGKQEITITQKHVGENELYLELYQPTLTTGTADPGEVLVPTNFSALAQGVINTSAATSAMWSDAGTFAGYFNGGSYGAGWLDQTGAAGTNADADRFLEVTQLGVNGGVNYSEINMGSGNNDIVVLSSNDLSANTLIFDGQFNDASNKVTILNFFNGFDAFDADDTQGAFYTNGQIAVGSHALDFTYYLNNTVDPSPVNTNSQSVVDLAVTLNLDATAEANSVSLLSYNQTATSGTFSSITAAQLVAALNTGTGTFGGIGSGTLSAEGTTTNLVGTTQQFIVMVENELNYGEYAVFHLTSSTTGDNTDYFAVGSGKLGTLDFGYSLGAGASAPLLAMAVEPTNGGGLTSDDFTELNLIGSDAANAALDVWLAGVSEDTTEAPLLVG